MCNNDETMQQLGIRSRIMTHDTIFVVPLIILKTTLLLINPSCTKVFGTHIFYEVGGGGLSRPPCDFENGRLYKLHLWQAIRAIFVYVRVFSGKFLLKRLKMTKSSKACQSFRITTNLCMGGLARF